MNNTCIIYIGYITEKKKEKKKPLSVYYLMYYDYESEKF